jgi:hypothetical protein
MTTQLIQSTTLTQVTEVHAGQDTQLIYVNPDGSMHIELIVTDDIGVEMLEG